MKELISCCHELMLLELRAQHTDQLLTLLHMAERIDLLCRGGIIEERNDGHTAKRKPNGQFDGSEPYAEDKSEGSDGEKQHHSENQVQNKSSEKTDRTVESDLYRQDSSSLKRSIRKYQKRIDEHNDKISNPQKYVSNWDSLDDRNKEGLLKHWKKEINNFSDSIQRREEELKRRGDYDE